MQRNCEWCGAPFEAKRSTAKYCKPSHRTQASLTRCKGDQPAAGNESSVAEVVHLPTGAAEDPTTTKAAVEKQLREAAGGKLHSYSGQLAVRLAARIDANKFDTGSAMAAVSKELDRVMSALLADVKGEPDALDTIQAEVIQMRTQRRRG